MAWSNLTVGADRSQWPLQDYEIGPFFLSSVVDGPRRMRSTGAVGSPGRAHAEGRDRHLRLCQHQQDGQRAGSPGRWEGFSPHLPGRLRLRHPARLVVVDTRGDSRSRGPVALGQRVETPPGDGGHDRVGDSSGVLTLTAVGLV